VCGCTPCFRVYGARKVWTFDTRRWLLNALYDCCPPDYKINKIMPRLKERATRDFQKHSHASTP